MISPAGDKTILRGVVGSTAYNLATEDSDIDSIAIHVAPTREVLTWGIQRPSIVTHEPDVTSHELGKYLNLAMRGNPTVTEAVWLDGYTFMSGWGAQLIARRHLLLSGPAIKSAYAGYATQQLKRHFNTVADQRRAKHIRHCFRLLMQAKELLSTGQLTVRLTDSQREYLFYLGRRADDQDFIGKEFEAAIYGVNNAYDTTSLPSEPYRDAVEEFLYQVRMNRIAVEKIHKRSKFDPTVSEGVAA